MLCYSKQASSRSPPDPHIKPPAARLSQKGTRLMKIEIPGYPSLDLKYLLLDYNGTIALDGIISEAVANKIRQLSDLFQIYVLTADTNGTARQMCEGLPV